MGDIRAISASDQAGIATAIVLHAALGAMLVYFASLPIPVKEEELEPPQGLTVSLATEVGLESTAPDAVLESRASVAPELGEPSAPPPDLAPLPEVLDAPPVEPSPAPTTPARTPTRRTTTPTRNTSSRNSSSRSNNSRSSTSRNNNSRSSSSSSSSSTRRNSGGSRISDDFLPGGGNSRTSNDSRLPASQIGGSATRSLKQEIDRQIKPHWRGKVPQGVDAEKLVSVLSFRLNENGSLKGRPSCRTKPSSITASNRPQAATHCERAVRAVQLAAPFKLPDKFYNGWKSIRNWEMKKQ